MENELQNQALTVLEQAQAMPVVASVEDYRAAGEFVVSCKQLIAKITDAHKPSIDAAHQSHKAAIALRDSHIEPIKKALAIVEPLALDFKRREDARAREEAARLAREKEAQAIEDAAKLEELGWNEEAEQKLAEAVAPKRIVPVAPAVPKVAGLSTRKKWTFRMVNPKAVNRQFCQPNESLIRLHVDGAFYKISQVTPEMIKRLEDEVGGIEVYEVETMVGRTK